MSAESLKKVSNPAKILLDMHREWISSVCPAIKKIVSIQLCTPLKPKGSRIVGAPEKCDQMDKCTSKKMASCLLQCSKITARRQK